MNTQQFLSWLQQIDAAESPADLARLGHALACEIAQQPLDDRTYFLLTRLAQRERDLTAIEALLAELRPH